MQTMINLPYRFNLHSLQVRWGNPKPQTPNPKPKDGANLNLDQWQISSEQ